MPFVNGDYSLMPGDEHNSEDQSARLSTTDWI